MFEAESLRAVPRTGSESTSALELSALLEAIRTLCDARRVDVLATDEAMRSTVSIAGAGADDHAESGPAGPVALLSDTAVMLHGEPRYLMPARSGADDTLTFRLAERGQRRFYLAIDMKEPGGVLSPRAGSLLPALTRTLAQMLDLETRLMASERERVAATVSLDQSRCCVITVTAEGRPVAFNQSAAECLAEEKVLQLRRGLVRPVDYADVVRFHAALDSVAQPGHGRVDGASAVVMLLKQVSTQRPPVLSITPAGLKPGAAAREDAAVAVIHMVQPTQEGARGMDTMCQLLGLSRVESRLVVQLHRGRTLTEAAAEMRIKVETARSYLKQIFNKTDTHRQSDLLSLLSHYSRVIRGNFAYRAL